MSKIVEGIAKDLKSIPEKLKAGTGNVDKKKLLLMNVKDPDNKDFWLVDEEAAEVVRLIFRLFLDGKNRNQIAVYLKYEQIPTPTFYMKDRGRGTCKNKTLNEENRYKWNKATLTHILTRQEYKTQAPGRRKSPAAGWQLGLNSV